MVVAIRWSKALGDRHRRHLAPTAPLAQPEHSVPMLDRYISEDGPGVRPLTDTEAAAFWTSLRASLDRLDLLDRLSQRLGAPDEVRSLESCLLRQILELLASIVAAT